MGQQPLTPEKLELGSSSTHGPESLGSAVGTEKEDLSEKGITIEEGTSLGRVFLLAEDPTFRFYSGQEWPMKFMSTAIGATRIGS
jgi:hypothetical protein